MFKKSSTVIYLSILLLSFLVNIIFLLIKNYSMIYIGYAFLAIPLGLGIGFIGCFLVVGFQIKINKAPYKVLRIFCWLFIIMGMFAHIFLFVSGFSLYFADVSQYDKFPIGYYTGIGVSFAAYHLKVKYLKSKDPFYYNKK